MVVKSGLLLVTLAKLSEHGAEARDSALLDGAERMAPVFIPGALGSPASFLISCLGPTHWKGIESTFTQIRSPGRTLSEPDWTGSPGPHQSPQLPRDSPWAAWRLRA